MIIILHRFGNFATCIIFLTFVNKSSTLVMLHLKNPDYEIQILCKLGSIYFAI